MSLLQINKENKKYPVGKHLSWEQGSSSRLLGGSQSSWFVSATFKISIDLLHIPKRSQQLQMKRWQTNQNKLELFFLQRPGISRGEDTSSGCFRGHPQAWLFADYREVAGCLSVEVCSWQNNKACFVFSVLLSRKIWDWSRKAKSKNLLTKNNNSKTVYSSANITPKRKRTSWKHSFDNVDWGITEVCFFSAGKIK